MDSPLPILSLAGAAVVGTAAVFPKLRARLALSRAKHRSLTGHAKMSRLVARLIPFYEFDIGDFFRSDGAPPAVAGRRQDGFFRLAGLYRQRFAKGRQMTLQAATRRRPRSRSRPTRFRMRCRSASPGVTEGPSSTTATARTRP